MDMATVESAVPAATRFRGARQVKLESTEKAETLRFTTLPISIYAQLYSGLLRTIGVKRG